MTGIRIARGLVVALVVFAPAGCGESPPPTPDPNELANAKVEAMKRLAEVMARDPNSPDVFEALDGFRNVGIDPAQHPEATREILDIYKTQIEGKYRGEYAEQVRLELLAFRNMAGAKK